MVVIGSGDLRYKLVEGWERLPADIAEVATGSTDRVCRIRRYKAPMLSQVGVHLR